MRIGNGHLHISAFEECKLGAVVLAEPPKLPCNNNHQHVQNGINLSKVVHFAEKPESYISKTINCGAYLMKPCVIQRIVEIQRQKEPRAMISIELDLIPRLMQLQDPPVYAFSQVEFWAPLKTPQDLLDASALLINSLTNGQKNFIHSSAIIHPTAKIRPNVAIEAFAEIGPRARLKDAMISQACEIGESSYLANCIVGEGTKVGKWSRIQEGSDQNSLTVLAGWNEVESEAVIRGCLVLPHKQLSGTLSNLIIM